jgi:hypothetical protein
MKVVCDVAQKPGQLHAVATSVDDALTTTIAWKPRGRSHVTVRFGLTVIIRISTAVTGAHHATPTRAQESDAQSIHETKRIPPDFRR